MKKYSKLREYFSVNEVMNPDSKYYPGKQEYSQNINREADKVNEKKKKQAPKAK